MSRQQIIMLKVTFFSFFLSFQLYSAGCISLKEDIIPLSTVNSCDKGSNGEISSFCNCDLFEIELSPTEELKTKNEHNLFIAKEFQKNITKTLYSISNDLNILDGKLGSDEEFDLFNSCNTNKLDEIAQECGEEDNSFLSLLGIDEIKKLKVQFKTELSKRQQPHINTGNSCHEDSKGYVNRCSPEAKSSCNMSDNIADAIFMDTSIRNLTKALIGYSELEKSSLDKDKIFYEQLDIADQTGIFAAMDNGDFNYKSLKSIVKSFESNPFLSELMRSEKSIPFLERILSKIRQSKNLDSNNISSTVYNLINDEIEKSKLAELKVKCESLYTKAKKFFCADSSIESKDSFISLPETKFMQVISSKNHNETAFGASKYYCSKVNVNSPSKIQDPIKTIQDILYESEKDKSSVEVMAYENFANQSQKVRGTKNEPALCQEITEVNKLASSADIDVNDTVTPKEKHALYTFQIEKYKERLSICKNEKRENEQKCDFINSLIKITNDKLRKAEELLDKNEAELKAALSAGDDTYVVKDRGYYERIVKLENNGSLAQRVLLGEAPTSPKDDIPTKEKEASKKTTNEKSETAIAPAVVANSPVVYKALAESKSTPQKSNTSSEPSAQTQSQQTTSFLNLEAKKDTDSLLQQIQLAKEKYSKLQSENPQRLKEIQSNHREQKNLDSYDNLTPDNINDMNLSQQQDTGQKTIKAANDLASGLKNKIINNIEPRSIASTQQDVSDANNEKLKNSDSVTLSPFFPSSGPLINKHGLIDADGNVKPIMEVKIKGSIENDLRDVLKKDKENFISHDKKMILSDPNQFKQFKILAKALEKKQTFLISRHDNEDIKLIVKYNNATRQYSVEPFADKERLIQYEADYSAFQRNISNAIKDKTFDTLMNKYKED